MTIEEIKQKFPALAAKMPDAIFTERELIVVDENYEEAEGEETAEFDPSEYSHMIYIAFPTVEILGAEGLSLLAQKLESCEKFSAYMASEEDLFGVQTDLQEEEIAEMLFGMVEEIVS